MPTTSEISTRLGADNSEYRSVMNQSVRVAEQTGSSILKKLDLRAGVTAIAAAIGFNMQSIAEGVARFYTGMSKELEDTYKELDVITKANAEATITSMRKLASEETKYHLLLKERGEILKRLAEGRTSEPLPAPSWISVIKATPSFGPIPNPFFDKGDAVAEEMNAARLVDAEKQKGRLTQISDELLAGEKSRVEKALDEFFAPLDTVQNKINEGLKTESEHREKNIKKAAEELSIQEQIAEAIDRANTSAASLGLEGLSPGEQKAISTWIKGGKVGPAPVISRSGELRKSLSDNLTEFGGVYLGPVRQPGDFSRASEAVLQEEIRRYQDLIQQIRNVQSFGAPEVASGGFARSKAIGQVEGNLRLATFELTQRRKFQTTDYNTALRNYAGDPLNFDQLYQSAQRNLSESQLIRAGIDKLNERLNQPLRTIDTRMPSPFGA